MRSLIALSCISVFAMIFSSCDENRKQPVSGSDKSDNTQIAMRDYGTEPTVLNIEAYTLANDNFRQTLWTGENLQLTLMSIPAGGEVGLELHPDIDQFLRIEEGEGSVMMGDAKDDLSFVESVKADFVILVPAGKWHNIVNTGSKPLKLYSIYAPVEHPHGTVHKTQVEAMEAEHHH